MEIPKAGDEVFATRFSHCRVCEFLSGEGAGRGKCSACGCPIQVKLRLASSSCPAGKWGAVSGSFSDGAVPAAAVGGASEKLLSTSIPSMARSFFDSAAKFVASGFPRTPIEVLQARLDACSACEHWNPSGFGGTGQCGVCKCSTQLKLRMATAECPLQRWRAFGEG